MRGVGRLATSVGVIMLVLAGGLAAPSAANNFTGANSATGCGAVNMADNNTHTYYYSALNPTVSAAVNWMRVTVFDPTDINTQLLSAPTSTTDVVAYDQDYSTFCGLAWDGPINIFGLVNCVSLTGARCQKFEMRFDEPDMLFMSQDQRMGVACHEQGHTLGLRHYEEVGESFDGCLHQFIPYPAYLSAHDIALVNANY